MRIIYTREAFERINIWCRNAGVKKANEQPKEFGWLFECEQDAKVPEDIIIGRLWLLPMSEASGGHYAVDAEMMAKFWEERMMAGDDLEKIRGWGHSHANMSAFQSSIDEANTEDLFKERDWALAVTHNAKGEVYAKWHLFKPFRVWMEKVQVFVKDVETPILLGAQQEIEEAFKSVKPDLTPITTSGYQSRKRQHYDYVKKSWIVDESEEDDWDETVGPKKILTDSTPALPARDSVAHDPTIPQDKPQVIVAGTLTDKDRCNRFTKFSPMADLMVWDGYTVDLNGTLFRVSKEAIYKVSGKYSWVLMKEKNLRNRIIFELEEWYFTTPDDKLIPEKIAQTENQDFIGFV